MRDDLGVYLKVLRSAMIELINKDYADFVNLSSNLIGLDKAINSIQTPLGQLREELLLVRQSIDDAMSDVSNQMGRRQELRERKRSLRSLMRAQTALKKLRILLSTGEDGCGGQCHLDSTVATLERAVAEYNQLQYNISKCQQYLSSKDHGVCIFHYISSYIAESISLGEKGKSGLTSSLAFYLMLGKLEEAERLYRQVVASAMNPIINEETLRSLPRGLPALYDKILLFADKDMKVLREITKDSERFPGIGNFNFFVRSFWPEVGNNLEVNLMSIYAAGDPDTFYQRYCETLRFVEELGKRCNNCDALNELNEHPNFISFMDKWNLPVYFQIRFQEIVKSLEVSFSNSEWESKSGSWKLVATETAWTSLMRCWESGVFLTPIAHKFWKLSLQIISRYCTWIGQVLNKVVFI
ncbi:hypothetical protein AAG570_008826 [Ranatra chinensis]|uniref:Conserved oligomeric Golgi complex subunit 2 n=1 Tax=Ranatra chinensis TaxID=642074 RepID=A0ABD0ZFC3_9HEMI